MAAPPTRVKLTPYRTFTNDQGRTFAVRIVPTGARYGRTNTLINNDGHGPLAEFYDVTFADDGAGEGDGFGPMGQFVSRYFVSDLLDTRNGRGTGGLDLQGGVPVWDIDAVTMLNIRTWLLDFADPTTPPLGAEKE